MTELVELIKKRKEAMYDGIAEQWHEHMDRAYEEQSDSLKEQMQVHRQRHEEKRAAEAEHYEEEMWAKPVDVTAWEEHSPSYEDMFGDSSITALDREIFCAYPLIRKAFLVNVFEEARRVSKSLIVWKDSLPPKRHYPKAIGKLLQFMEDTWGEQPPYIEVRYEAKRYGYSIKPVWEQDP